MVAHDDAEIPGDGSDGGRRRVAGLAWFTEEEEDHKEHRENAERRNAVNILDAEVAMSPGGEIGPGGTADVDHRVVNGIADRADVFLGSTGRGADHAWLHQRNSECGKDQDKADKQAEW